MEFRNVDEYLSGQSAETRDTLEQLRHIIRTAAPEAEEIISYQMPAFRYHGMLVWYAGYKGHIGMYVLPGVLLAFRDRLNVYELSKSAIRFPLTQPLPEELISEIIMYAANNNLDRKKQKESAKARKSKQG
jgi:uncharacterized protein YdhG (YjbR/CyaY superfamily)